jgi:biuret amidohydrolase
MERAFRMDIPRTMEEACDPRRTVLLVYDMQVGIASQLPQGPEVTARVGEVLSAAREGGFRMFFSHHTSLPKELMGASRLRQAMAWQRVNKVEEVVSPFPLRPLKPQIVPELTPLPSEAVSDKIAMSAFE